MATTSSRMADLVQHHEVPSYCSRHRKLCFRPDVTENIDFGAVEIESVAKMMVPVPLPKEYKHESNIVPESRAESALLCKTVWIKNELEPSLYNTHSVIDEEGSTSFANKCDEPRARKSPLIENIVKSSESASCMRKLPVKKRHKNRGMSTAYNTSHPQNMEDVLSDAQITLGFKNDFDDCGKDWLSAINKQSNSIPVSAIERKYKCIHCDKSHTRHNVLKNNSLNHVGKRDNKCDICHGEFTARGILNYHILSEAEERKYKCQKCSKSYKRSNDLKFHNANVHNGDEEFKCGMCGDAFKNSRTLDKHVRTHREEQPPRKHGCSFCDKTFKRSNDLKIHIFLHTGERNFGCDVCKRTFTTNSSRTRHARVHVKEWRNKNDVVHV